MHHDEKWQLFNDNCEPKVGEWRSAEKGNPKSGDQDIVGGAVVYLFRKNEGNEIELLWQQRSEQLSDFPGKWDVSAGGHVNLGETFAEAAVREAREEIGIKISVDDLILVAFRRSKNIVNFIYLVDWTGKKEDYVFDDGEVAGVKWVPLSETDAFRKEFAKRVVAEDDATFISIQKWFG